MSTPALALVPVLPASTGIGANTGTSRPKGHRKHAPRENTDGNKEGGKPGRSAGRQWPGAPMIPLSFHPATWYRQHGGGGWP